MPDSIETRCGSASRTPAEANATFSARSIERLTMSSSAGTAVAAGSVPTRLDLGLHFQAGLVFLFEPCGQNRERSVRLQASNRRSGGPLDVVRCIEGQLFQQGHHGGTLRRHLEPANCLEQCRLLGEGLPRPGQPELLRGCLVFESSRSSGAEGLQRRHARGHLEAGLIQRRREHRGGLPPEVSVVEIVGVEDGRQRLRRRLAHRGCTVAEVPGQGGRGPRCLRRQQGPSLEGGE